MSLILPHQGIIKPTNKELSYFQKRGIMGNPNIPQDKSIYGLLNEGKKEIIALSPGGSGKTVMMSWVANDFINSKKHNKDVCVFVHRQELLEHFRIEIYDWHGVFAYKIDSETNNIPSGVRVYACMIETFESRKTDPNFIKNFRNVGLVMVDECHLNNFKKIFSLFPKPCIRIGWTATGISAVKNDPLINHYEDIVVISTIDELVELNQQDPTRGIVTCSPEHDYVIDNDVDPKSFKKNSKGEIDENDSGRFFSQDRQIANTILAYEEKALKFGYKTLIFNANVEHSIKMHEALLKKGYNSQHIDSSKKSKYGTKAHREFILGKGNTKGWIDKQDGSAILNNVGIATIGTDIKSIECVIINKSTLSFTLFWQMAYRGDRALVFEDGRIKTHFVLIDMGNNMPSSEFGGNNHGRFNYPIDWEYIFFNPNLPRPKIPPIRSCPECGAILSASARICTAKVDDWISGEEIECGYTFPFTTSIKEDEFIRKLIRMEDLLKKEINVKENIKYFKEQGRKESAVFFEIIRQICNLYQQESPLKSYLEQDDFDFVCKCANAKINEWFKEIKEKKWIGYKDRIKENCKENLKKLGFILNLEEEEILRPDQQQEQLTYEEYENKNNNFIG